MYNPFWRPSKKLEPHQPNERNHAAKTPFSTLAAPVGPVEIALVHNEVQLPRLGVSQARRFDAPGLAKPRVMLASSKQAYVFPWQLNTDA